MKQKLKDIWNSSGRWFLIGLPIAAAVIAAAAWQANRMLTPPAQTIAQPPVEQEVTFDIMRNVFTQQRRKMRRTMFICGPILSAICPRSIGMWALTPGEL